MSAAGPAAETTVWSPARRQLAALTVAVSLVTATYAALVGGTVWHAWAGGGYVLVSAVAVAYPAALAGSVVVGLGLAWSTLADHGGVGALVLVPLVVGVVATAELVGLGARLGIVLERNPSADLRRVAVTLVVTAAVSATTLLIGLLRGPGGTVAVTLAVGASLVLAMLLLGGIRHTGDGTTEAG